MHACPRHGHVRIMYYLLQVTRRYYNKSSLTFESIIMSPTSRSRYVNGVVLVLMLAVSRHHHVHSFNMAIQSFPTHLQSGRCGRHYLFHNLRRTRHTTNNKMINDRTTIHEIDIYNEAGEELNIDGITLNETNAIDTNYYAPEEVGDDSKSVRNDKKKIECSASIDLPFSAEVAFAAFSDLTRQPSWCEYLHSVEYIGLVNEDDEIASDDSSADCVPLRSTKWTVSVKGIRFSWTASDTRIILNKRIEWASNSGLKNVGSVVFTPSSSDSTTHMELCFTFVLPRVVSSLYRRLNIRKYTEDVLLADMLRRFRDVVMEEDLQIAN